MKTEDWTFELTYGLPFFLLGCIFCRIFVSSVDTVKTSCQPGVPGIRAALMPPSLVGLAFFYFLQSHINLPAQTLRFHHITMEHGLSQDIVTAIAQDGQGFMWFGTEHGLNKYDGYSVVVFKNRARDTNSIWQNGITKLHTDRQGRLWVGTGAGLCLYDRDNENFIRFATDVPAAGVTAICGDPDSSVWVGTSKGLFGVDVAARRMVRARSNDTILQAPTSALHIEESGLCWVTTPSGLTTFRIHKGVFIREAEPSVLRVLRGKHVTIILRDSAGRLWVAGMNGLFRVDRAMTRVKHFTENRLDPRSLQDSRILAIAEDTQGQIWVGTFQGLERYEEGGGFEHFRQVPNIPTSLLGERVYSLYVSPKGDLWAGTYRGGVNRLDPQRQKFHHVRIASEYAGDQDTRNVYAIFESANGDLWVGSDAGLFRRQSGSKRFLNYASVARNGLRIKGRRILVIGERRNGDLWFGGEEGHIFLRPRGTDRILKLKLPVSEGVRSIFEDRDGTLWLGTEKEGVYTFDERLGIFVLWRDGVDDVDAPNRGVWSMYQDRAGHIWFGTWWTGNYLLKLDKATGRSQRFMLNAFDERAPGGVAARAFYEDIGGSLWFGTWGGGLHRYDPLSGTFENYTESEGLANNFVKGMLADARGYLWISTENGLSRFHMKSRTFKTFAVEDGLQANFFWSGAFCKGANGMMYFGGTNGFNLFHPDSVKDNPNLPPVVITRFRVHDRAVPMPVATSRPLTLRYEDDFFSFEFVGLDYTNPGRNQYAYMLEGFDERWVHAGTRRYAAYTKMDPGNYVFRVKASNNDEVWNEVGASVEVIIVPPFWMTWWFRVMVVASLAIGLYALYRFRMNRVLEMERLRQRISRDLHDDVGTDLSAIVLASRVTGQKYVIPEGAREQVEDMGKVALRAQELMREIVWMLNPVNDSLRMFVSKMKEEASRLLKEIEYTIESPPGELGDVIDPVVKRNIFLIYKEALNNIVRHSRASRVTVHLSVNRRKMLLEVFDNGVGFEPAGQGRGNGLSNMRARAAQIGGSLEITSAPGQGTRIQLRTRIA